MSLLVPINFTMDTNALPVSYSYSLDLGLKGTFEPNVTSQWVGDRLLIKGTYVINLKELLSKLGKKDVEKLERALNGEEPIKLQIGATGPCGNEISDEADFTVCRGNKKPELFVKVEEEYQPGESIVPEVKATDPNGNMKGVYVSFNGGLYMEYREGTDISSYLTPYTSNVVRFKAVDLCGASTVVALRIKIAGPPVNGSWVVDNSQTCQNREYTINGSLLITGRGSLELRNCKLHILGNGVELNGTLKVLGGSLIDGENLNLTGSNGVFKIDSSQLRGFTEGIVNNGKITVENSHLTGIFTFNLSDVLVTDSEIEGGFKTSGNLTIKGSEFSSGIGLLFAGGALEIENSLFHDGLHGIHVRGTSTATVLRNIRVEHSVGAGILIEGTGSKVVLDNITAINNGIGIRIDNRKFVLENSLLTSNDNVNLYLTSPVTGCIVMNSTIEGSSRAILVLGYGGLTVNNTNVSGNIETKSIVKFIAPKNSSVVIKNGRASLPLIEVYGDLTVQSYEIDSGSLWVYGGGKALIADWDGVPATEESRGDASIINETSIHVDENGELVVLNSILKDSSLSLSSEKVLIRGSLVEGGVFNAYRPYRYGSESVSITEEEPVTEDGEWFYSTDYPGENWIYSTSMSGMTLGNAPFVASFYRGRSDANTEVGQFTNLYLKKVITLNELPNRAWLEYYAISGVEIYINGRKVVDKLNYRAQLTFTQGWGGGTIKASPLMGATDVSGYLMIGKNVIAVHVRVPSDNSHYLSLGAFAAELHTWSGVLGITESIVKTSISTSRTGLSIVGSNIEGNISSFDGPMIFVDSDISGTTKIRGELYAHRTNFTGMGSGVGISIMGGKLILNQSSVRNFAEGILSGQYGNLMVYSSEITSNGVAINFSGLSMLVDSSYLTRNDVGIQAEKPFSIHNSVLYGNDVGINSTSTVIADHDTLNGNSIGMKLGGGLVTNDLIQDNTIGILVNSSFPLRVENSSLINGKDVHIISAGDVLINETDWGGYTPKMVTGYSGGAMYTQSGNVEVNYDILDERISGSLTLGKVISTGYSWGSSLLYASLSVAPSDGSMVEGTITLHGTASSRRGIVRVNYTLLYNGTETLIGNFQTGGSYYNNYIYLDTVSHNLSGSGAIKFTAVDSEGKSISAVKKVYFRNAHVKLVNVEASHPTAIYTLSKVINANTSNSHKVIPYKERFANVTVVLRNTGYLNGTIRLELILPDYIERHTGRITAWLPVAAGDTVTYRIAFPLTVYDWIKLKWDPQPEEFPMNKVIPFKVRLYGEDGELLDEEESVITFDFGPVFSFDSLNAYPFSEKYCNDYPNSCHLVNVAGIDYTYDGDGDNILEATESYHFSLSFTNIGDTPAYLSGVGMRETIPEKDYFLSKGLALKGHSAWIDEETGRGMTLKDSPQDVSDILGVIEPGSRRVGKDLWMCWWNGDPPYNIPPYNYTGYYTNYLLVIYHPVDAHGNRINSVYYTTPSVNKRRVYVKALEKSFHSKTVNFDPILVTVEAVNDNKTYLSLRNTNDNVFYDYYVEGSFGPNEGYKWYHIIPPGFTFKAVADNSKSGVHYRVDFGALPSLLGNEFQVIAIGVNGILGIFGIKVPIGTIVLGIAKAALKIVNIVETAMEFENSKGETEWNFSTVENSPDAKNLSKVMMNSNQTLLVHLNVSDFSRFEKKYGMSPEYYNDLKNLDELSSSRQMKVMKTLGKAIVLDEDLRMVLIETIIESVDMDIYYDVLKEIYAIYQGNTEESIESGQASLESLGMNIIEQAIKNVMKKRLQNTNEYKSALKKGTKEADELVDKASAGPIAVITTTISLGTLVYSVATAPVPQAGTILVLDPPGNYTVKMEKEDKNIVFGGLSNEKGIGWGNTTITFGKKDVYHAEYTAFTQSLSIGTLFRGMLERAEIEMNTPGALLIRLKPRPENATMVRAVFLDETYARIFTGAYLRNLSSVRTEINGSWITIEAKGELPKLSEDEEVHIRIIIDENYTRANVTRIGHYRGTVEIKPMFGISSNYSKVVVEGGNASVGRSEDGFSLVVPENESQVLEPPNVTAIPLKIQPGDPIEIIKTKPCILSWSIANKSGIGRFVRTEGLTPGSYVLKVNCIYGNLTVVKEFNVTVTKPPLKLRKLSGTFVNARGNVRFIARIGTDFYLISFVPRTNLGGVLGVSQRPGKAEAPEGYEYITYALFNVTHPTNWSVKNVTIKFRVSKEWMKENNVSRGDILLLHRENGWVEYKPVFEYEDLRYVYYKVSVPSLSLFAVAEKVKIQTHEETGTSEEHETPTETPGNTESSTETPSAPVPEGGSTAYYILVALVLLTLIGIYVYRRR
ncbi:PGF-pre-PGF domain-containing protein [Thermococcus sp.]